MIDAGPSTGRAPFRVLCISGGGARGVLAAAAIAELDKSRRVRLGASAPALIDHFDLVVGTSTGALIAIALAFRTEPERLVDCYRRMAPALFPPRLKWVRLLKAFIGPMCRLDRLRSFAEQLIDASATLGTASCPVVVTAVERVTGRPVCLKTSHHPSLTRDGSMLAVEAALASAAAPIVFEPCSTQDHRTLLDGGLWANNPVLVGLIEARHRFGQQLGSIRIASVGTGKFPFKRGPWYRRQRSALEYVGITGGKMLELVWRGQSEFAVNASRQLLADGALVEVDADLPAAGRGCYEMTDARPDTMHELEELGRRAGQTAAPSFFERFLRDGVAARHISKSESEPNGATVGGVSVGAPAVGTTLATAR